jgi:hypothetical protein
MGDVGISEDPDGLPVRLSRTTMHSYQRVSSRAAAAT